jgi:hypothetical protein
MKRLVYFFAVLSLTVFACAAPATATPTQPPAATLPPSILDTPVVVTQPPVATEPPTASAPPVPAPNVTCQKLSLYVDLTLATSVSCETVPASNEGIELYPEYTKLTLQGYPLQDKFFPAMISVIPVQAYTTLLPDFIPGQVAYMQALTSGGLPDSARLPFLPVFNAAQTFHSNFAVMPFVNGSGIRFLTLYAQYAAPVNNHDLFYTYQGLTADGQYWVSAVLPVNHASLPADASNPPGGVTWEQFSNDYTGYIANMVAQLDAQAADSYTPSMTALDSLVASITILP